MTDSLLREVDDALRQDKMAQLWMQWRKPLAVAVVAIIVATAGNSIWQQHREQHARKAMHLLSDGMAAFQKKDYDKAAQQFAALAQDNSGDLRDMAQLWQARALIAQDNNTDKAAALLTGVAEHPSGNDTLWRDLACLHLAGLSDKPWPAACDGTDDSPLVSQREELSAARLWQAGKAKEAAALLDKIVSSTTITDTERARAQQLLSTVKQQTPPANEAGK